MELLGERLIPASIERTWAALNDPEILQQSLPGCELLERTEQDQFAALLALRIGPVNAKFKGQLRLSEMLPLRGYTLHFEGQGGVAGFGKGSADVQLAAHDANTTRLSYKAKAQVGGKIAQIGSRLVDATAAKMAEDFFNRFEEVLSQDTSSATNTEGCAESAQPPSTVSRPIRLWLWAVAAAVVAMLEYSLRHL